VSSLSYHDGEAFITAMSRQQRVTDPAAPAAF
jgi:hypothetical protein